MNPLLHGPLRAMQFLPEKGGKSFPMGYFLLSSAAASV